METNNAPNPGKKNWVICPVCQKPNPEGAKYCHHCWGAALAPGKIVSDAELPEFLTHIQKQRKLRRMLKITAIIATPFVIITIIIIILSNYTDIISKPLITLNSSSHLGEWAMFRHDLTHSGTSEANTLSPQGKIQWTFSTGGPIESSPTVTGGTVYFGSRDGKLYAVDTNTGNLRWEFQTGSWVDCSPAVFNSVVYVGSNDGNLYALDAGTGKKLWLFHTINPIVSSPAVVDGRIYFGSEDFNFYALNAATGKQLWQFRAAGPIKSSPVVANGLVYFGSGNEFIYALNAVNGKLHLRYKALSMIDSSPAVAGTTVYFGNSSGALYALEGNARNWFREYTFRPFWIQLWAMHLAPTPPDLSGFKWSLKLGNTIQSSPLIVNDVVYVGVDNNLKAVNLQNKQVLWTFSSNGSIRSSAASSGDTIYAGSDDGRLYAIDSTNGNKLWEILTGDKIGSSPSLADGIIYVGSDDGKLYAIK